jgi:hypothetical protein
MSFNQRDIKLRPHHLWGLADIQENTENYYLPNEEYITNWREQEGEIKYTEKLILHGRGTVRFLFENPDYEFTYVDGINEVDTICLECNTFEECHDPECESFNNAQEWDKEALTAMPFLTMMEFGKKYNLNKFIEIRQKFEMLKQQ